MCVCVCVWIWQTHVCRRFKYFLWHVVTLCDIVWHFVTLYLHVADTHVWACGPKYFVMIESFQEGLPCLGHTTNPETLSLKAGHLNSQPKCSCFNNTSVYPYLLYIVECSWTKIAKQCAVHPATQTGGTGIGQCWVLVAIAAVNHPLAGRSLVFFILMVGWFSNTRFPMFSIWFPSIGHQYFLFRSHGMWSLVPLCPKASHGDQAGCAFEWTAGCGRQTIRGGSHEIETDKVGRNYAALTITTWQSSKKKRPRPKTSDITTRTNASSCFWAKCWLNQSKMCFLLLQKYEPVHV